MFNIIFVLVISGYAGGINTDLHFSTMSQCETAKMQIYSNAAKGNFAGMTCVEMRVPVKKTKCKVINDFSYQNPHYRSSTTVLSMDNYPYPIAFECVEE